MTESRLRGDLDSGPRLSRIVVVATLFISAGHSLTSGGFLQYLANDIDQNLSSLVVTLPEMIASVGVVVPWLIGSLTRKQVWLISTLLGRVFLLPLPFIPLLELESKRELFFTFFVLAQVTQGISLAAYMGWIGEIVPRNYRGRFLAWRQFAIVLITGLVTVCGGMMRDYWKREVRAGDLASGTVFQAYQWINLTGTLLWVIGIILLLRLPSDIKKSSQLAENSETSQTSRNWIPLLAFHWWFSFSSGLTQVAFFKFRVDYLGIGLGTYYLLETLMRVIQIPASLWAGSQCDQRDYNSSLPRGRNNDFRSLYCSVMLLSLSMIFWILPFYWGWYWLIGGYLLWGAWGAYNVASPTLVFHSAPAGKITHYISIQERISGLLAGISGMIGGWVLGETKLITPLTIQLFQWIFLIGLLGRLASLGLLSWWHRSFVRTEGADPSAQSLPSVLL